MLMDLAEGLWNLIGLSKVLVCCPALHIAELRSWRGNVANHRRWRIVPCGDQFQWLTIIGPRNSLLYYLHCSHVF